MQNTHSHPQNTHLRQVTGFEQAVTRARAEFLEMPGLRLNAAQAARLWSCDAALSDAVLTSLTEAHFLARTRDGSFIRS